jgi:hypothetical protein
LVRGAQLMAERRHVSCAQRGEEEGAVAGCGNCVLKPFSPHQILAKIYAIPVPSLALIAAVSLSLAQSGHRDMFDECPFSGVKRTLVEHFKIFADDPFLDIAEQTSSSGQILFPGPVGRPRSRQDFFDFCFIGGKPSLQICIEKRKPVISPENLAIHYKARNAKHPDLDCTLGLVTKLFLDFICVGLC